MQAYDAARFDPPAPLALVTVLSEPPGVVIHDVPMLLDTLPGRVPAPPLTRRVAGVARRKAVRAGSLRRDKEHRAGRHAELRLLGKSFRGQFLLIDSWHGVLGRNVLNNLSLLFDGPSRKWTEQP